MPSSSASSIFFQRGGHFFAPLQADQVHLACAHAQCGERDVDHFPRGHGGDVLRRRLDFLHAASMLLNDFARGRARYIHGNVAPTDHDDFFADGEFVAEVHVQQKIDALVNAIEIDAREC